MSRTISPTLLAAAQSGAAVAIARVRAHRARRAWTVLWANAALNPNPTSAVCVEGVLHRVRISGGAVQYQAITDPTQAAQWTAWTSLWSNAAATADVAITHNAAYDELRIAYQDTSLRVVIADSANGGATWSSPRVVEALAGVVWLALHDRYVLYQDATTVVLWTAAGGGGAPAGKTTLASGLSLPRGVGASGPGHADWRLLYGADRSIWLATLAGTTVTVTRRLDPGGDQAVATGAEPSDPDLVYMGGGYQATWVDRNSGAPSWAQEITRHSPDGEHFGWECALACESATIARMALAWDAVARRLHAGHDAAALAAYDEGLDPDAPGADGPLDLLRYRRTAAPEGGRLELEFLDPDGSHQPYAALGVAAPGSPWGPLSAVVVERGYRTAAGVELVAADPCYLVRVARSQGLGAGHVRATAVDGLGLLGLLRPRAPLTFLNRSVAWLCAEIAGQAGLTFADDGDAAWGQPVASFTLYPNRSLGEALADALRLAGGVACCGYAAGSDGGALAAHVLAGHLPADPPDLGDAAELRAAAYGAGWRWRTATPAIGQGAATFIEDVAAAMGQGLRTLAPVADWRITTALSAYTVAAHEQAAAQAGALVGELTAPLRPDLELWDQVRLTADAGDVHPSYRRRTITRLDERYDAPKGIAETRLELGGA